MEATVLTSQIVPRTGAGADFARWQARLQACLIAFPGFTSLEIQAPGTPGSLQWMVVQRFRNPDSLACWRDSTERRRLLDELVPLLPPDVRHGLNHQEEPALDSPETSTEVIVTDVSPGREEAYRAWCARVHQIEAEFPGFKSVRIQAPETSRGRRWVTFLRFDSAAHLDNWLQSPQRRQVLEESTALVTALESRRMMWASSGWFNGGPGESGPTVWKRTLLVLLLLYPIVMLEARFLSPLVNGLNPALGLFIGNIISVSMIPCLMMPIAVRWLGWWLNPGRAQERARTLLGTGLITGLYLVEIAVFWARR